MIEKDLEVFFNQDEFSEFHLIDGIEIECIISDNEELNNSKDNYGSTYIATKSISIKKKDYINLERYAQGDEIFVDETRYFVSNIRDGQNVVTLKLEGVRI